MMSFLSLSRLSKQKNSDSTSQDRKTSRKDQIEREQKSQGGSFQTLKKHLSHTSSKMEARMGGLSLGEGSSRKDWRNLFTECHEAREIILGRIDLESALACRLVCKEWRETVNCFKKLWTKINKVISLAVVNFCTHDPTYGLKRHTLKKIT